MRRFIKCMCLALVLALMLSTTAFAEEEKDDVSGTYSYYFSSYGAWIAKITDRVMEISFDVITRGIMDELGASSIELQQSSNGTSGWSTIKTFTPDKYAQMMDSNSSAHGECVNYTGTTGYYYRAYVTFYASNSNGFGEVTWYSDVIKI